MELHQIRYFLAVCETLHFTRASTRCHVSQPSLTRAIKLLEQELGGPLFNRERGNTHLTELGASVAPHLRASLEQAVAARSRAAALLGLRSARLTLGVAAGVAPCHLQPLLGAYAAAHPEVELALLDGPRGVLHAALRHGDIDVAFLDGRPHDIDDLHYHEIGRERMQLLLPAGRPLAEHDPVPARELAGAALASWDGCRGLPVLERLLAEGGPHPGRRLTARTPDLVPLLVTAAGTVGLREQGYGVPGGLVGRTLAELAGEWPLHVATKRGRPYSPPVRALMERVLRRRTGVVAAALPTGEARLRPAPPPAR
jgi:DNA-binding transcriptional LysR family regulator